MHPITFLKITYGSWILREGNIWECLTGPKCFSACLFIAKCVHKISHVDGSPTRIWKFLGLWIFGHASVSIAGNQRNLNNWMCFMNGVFAYSTSLSMSVKSRYRFGNSKLYNNSRNCCVCTSCIKNQIIFFFIQGDTFTAIFWSTTGRLNKRFQLDIQPQLVLMILYL